MKLYYFVNNKKLNTYLKELYKLADHLTEGAELGRTKGGVHQLRYVPKWDLVTSHTARRSFATNAYLAGVNPIMIMKVTGHRSEAVFLRYIKVSSEQNALLLLQHSHFAIVKSWLTDEVRPKRSPFLIKNVTYEHHENL